MATVAMKKLSAVILQSDADRLIRRLQRLGCVSVDASADVGDAGEEDALQTPARRDATAALARTEERVAAALELLHRRYAGKRLQAMPVDRPAWETYPASDSAREADKLLAETEAALSEEARLDEEDRECDAVHDTCLPWVGVDLPMGFAGTDKTKFALGAFPSTAELPAATRELEDAGAMVCTVYENAAGYYAAVLWYAKDDGEVSPVLTRHGFLRMNFAGIDETAASRVAAAEEKKKENAAKREALREKEAALAEKMGVLEIYADYITSELRAEEARAALGETAATAVLTGWVPAGEEARVTRVLERADCAYEFRDPEDGENAPVLLRNPSFFKPFEMVMGIYSLPAYGTFDPTVIMSVFYAIIFGCMMADVGYGLILFAGCTVALRFPKFRALADYLNLFRWCGVSCIIAGVLFGGWFGDLPSAIFGDAAPAFMTKGLVPFLNPMDFNGANGGGPLNFMIFTLAFGALHLFTGMGIQFYILCKEGKWLDAVFDIGSWYVLFGGAVVFLLGQFVGIGNATVGMWIAVGGAGMIVLTAGRREKNILMKFLKGLLGLYGLINYLSDMLSYSRILALGLASAVIAMVINLLTGMGGAMLLFAVPVMILAHLFNLALNLLGTFVHTSRLQFIEFFGKFFVDGGDPFTPLREGDTYTADPAPAKEDAAEEPATTSVA